MLDTISMATKLEGEYKLVFEKADIYSTLTMSGDEYIKDEQMMNLYDILLQAQEDNKPVAKIVGEDIEDFCKRYFDNQKNKIQKFITVTNVIYRVALCCLFAAIIEVLCFSDDDLGLNTKIDIIPLVIGCIMGGSIGGLCLVVKNKVFKYIKIKPITFYFIILVIFTISLLMVSIISTKINVEFKIDSGMILIVSMMYVISYLITRSIWRYNDHGTFGKYSKEEKIRRKAEKIENNAFNKEVSKNNIIQITKSVKIRYNRLNRRYQKKHGEDMSLKLFKNKISKELINCDIYEIVYVVLDALIVLNLTIQETVTEGIDGGMIFGALAIIVFYFIYCIQRWVNNVFKETYHDMLYIIELCLKNDLELDSVCEMIELGKMDI